MDIIQKCNRELLFLKKNGVYDYAVRRFPKLLAKLLVRETPVPNRKHEALNAFLERYAPPIFVETGTYLGDTIYALRDKFKKIHSIELDPDLYKNAASRFARQAHISIYQGDSGEILPEILSRISETCLFWLDAHYSKGITARSVIDTPIAKELNAIFTHHIKNHVVLIDDARYFNGIDGYPTIQELETYVRTKAPHCAMEVREDIIRIYPKI